MLLNYFKVALRNLRRGGIYSVINIVGLSIGAAVSILMILYAVHERSYDRFHKDSENIYRAWVKEHFKGDVFFNTVTPIVLGNELRQDFPEFEDVTRYGLLNALARSNGEPQQEVIHIADPNFFDVFSFEFTEGNGTSSLSEINNVVITEEYADKYFGSESPIGKTLQLQFDTAWVDYKVVAVTRNIPSNSSIQYDLVVPFENADIIYSERAQLSWTIVAVETYMKVDPAADFAALESKIADFIDNKVADIYKPGEYIVGLQPLHEIHLDADIPTGIVPVSDARYPRIMMLIAILILTLACINFTALGIGRSISRAKEVGVRKVTGALRKQLIGQFTAESVLTSFIAVGIGIGLAGLALPAFNQLADKTLSLPYNSTGIAFYLGLALIIGVLAGIYPAFVLSGANPIKAFQGSPANTKGDRHTILKWLVGAQYALSIALIISTLLIQQQLSFLQNKDLGLNPEQVIAVGYQEQGSSFSQTWESAHRIVERLNLELAGNDAVIDIASSSHTVGTPGWFVVGYTEQSTDRFRKFTTQQISPNYLDMMEIELVEGRSFHEGAGTDMSSVIINQAMVDGYGWEAPIGKQLPDPFHDFQIVGVASDFNFTSLHNPVSPLVMAKNVRPIFNAASDHNNLDPPTPKISIKLNTEDFTNTIQSIEQAWVKVVPGYDFDFVFIDDNIEFQYRAEQRLGSILFIATVLAILIAALGLFGIGVLTTARRVKEIGVRKVLGASTSDIVIMLNKQISIVVLISTLIAIPVAWYLIGIWLEDFAYRITMSPLTFLLAGIVAFVVAWLSVGYQSVSAAVANPVDSLRSE